MPELSTPLTLEAGRVMRAAEGLSDIGAVVALPCGDGTGTLVATHHGAARQSEKSRSRMAFATRRANVRAVGEDLDAWMGWAIMQVEISITVSATVEYAM